MIYFKSLRQTLIAANISFGELELQNDLLHIGEQYFVVNSNQLLKVHLQEASECFTQHPILIQLVSKEKKKMFSLYKLAN